MIYFTQVSIPDDSGAPMTFNVFLGDLATGHTAKSVCSIPGAYEEVCEVSEISMQLVELKNCTIGYDGKAYSTAIYGLIIVPNEGADVKTLDVTNELTTYLNMPQVAAETMFKSLSDKNREILSSSLEAIRFCEGLTDQSTVCLPEGAFEYLDPEVAKKMRSVRKVYTLKAADNIEQFQKDCTSPYLVPLPSVEEIHNARTGMSSLDILRVIAPYRQEKQGGMYWAYSSIYHTPYYKVNSRIRGVVPECFDWIDGYFKNDTVPLQPWERKQADNIYSLYCADISRSISKIVTSIFLDTPLGTALRRMVYLRDLESLSEVNSEIMSLSTDSYSCYIPLNDLETLVNTGCQPEDAAQLIVNNLKFGDGALKALVSARDKAMNVVNVDSLPFVLTLTDEEKNEFTDELIGRGLLTSAMFNFIRTLCSYAYTVNWGHTGITKAIPVLVDESTLSDVDSAMANWVTYCETGSKETLDQSASLLFQTDSDSDDDDSSSQSTNDDDDPYSAFDRYVSRETLNRIRMSELPPDYFDRLETLSAEERIVQRWCIQNGDNGLFVFLSMVHSLTGSPKALIECFIRLMRWGDMKPKVLALPDYSEVNQVFDLGEGEMTIDSGHVDDSMLIRKNGCRYSLVEPLYAKSPVISVGNPVVGFWLKEDYGEVQVNVLMSWNDLGKHLMSDAIDIAEFATVNKASMALGDCTDIEGIAKLKHQMYTSSEHISEAFDRKMPAEDLNDLALLTTPNITASPKYIKSLRNKDIITASDLQYARLRAYLVNLEKFYQRYQSDIENVATTGDIAALAKAFVALAEAKDEPLTNTGTAKALNLNAGAKAGKYVDDPLEGQFMLVFDDTSQAPFVPLAFSDPLMRKTSEKLRGRIVLLLLAKEDKFIFCRKDITIGEVMRSNNTLVVQRYGTLAKAVETLAAGKDVRISGRPAYLHSDLRQSLE